MSESTISYLNSFNSGDLISMLPGIQNQYRKTGKKAKIFQRLNMPAFYGHNDGHPIKDGTGKNVCMNEKMFYLLKWLIESQEYVESYNIFRGQSIDVNFDLTRQNSQIPLPNGLIHYWVFLSFPQLECDLSERWLKVEENELYRDRIIINRTERYNNPYIDFFFLKEHEKNLLFSGTEAEHKVFCDQFGLDIPLLFVKEFLELAQAIYSCRFFIGGQSMCWHISDAMKTKRLLEVCTVFPNTFPTGANGHSFLTQNALELKFKKLLKETE